MDSAGYNDSWEPRSGTYTLMYVHVVTARKMTSKKFVTWRGHAIEQQDKIKSKRREEIKRNRKGIIQHNLNKMKYIDDMDGCGSR